MSGDDEPGLASGNVLRIPAKVAELAAVRQFIRRHAWAVGADPDAVADIVQAVDESVTNSIVHGYDGADGTVEIEVARDGRALIVRVRDKAPPFDPTLVPRPDTTLSLAQRRGGGLGVFLTRELTDAVTYRHTGEGNELTLVKECVSPEGGARC